MSGESESEPITVIVVDDQSIVRAGLRMMLDAEPDIVVVDEARDGQDAIRSAAEHRPDVMLMDIRMPGLDGVEATRQIVNAGTAGAVVIITTFDDEEYLLSSIRVGACGFLLKDAGPDLLAAAVRAARRGDSLIDPAMTKSLVEHRLRSEALDSSHSPQHAEQRELLEDLSVREREVLAQLARGLNNGEIAELLYISEATVKSHVSSVLLKTRTRSRVQAAVFAYETGFVRPGWLAASGA